MARNVAWGIDIGDSAIKAVRLRKVGDSIVIQEYRTIACESRPEEAQAGDKEYRVRNALTAFLREVKLKSVKVVASMSGRDVFPRFIPLPPVEKKRIPEIVRYEARTQMPFPIEEVIWDYQPITGDSGAGEEVEVGIFAIKKATVYGFLTNLRLARLMPDIVEIGPLALYNFLMYDRHVDVGTVVIDIGSGTTDLVIIDGERFWTRNVSISGNDITRALQEKYQISFEEAENLKLKAATSKQADKLFGTMRPILDDLVGEIQRSIGYYKAQTRNVRIEQVLLLGNAFKLKGLVEYFRANLDYEVTLLQELRRLRLGAEADAGKFEADLPNYAVAIGLALQGLGLARVNIDMMPRDVVRERVLRQKVPYAAAAVGFLILPLLFGFRSAQNDLSRCEQEIQRIEPLIQEANQKVEERKKAADLSPMKEQLEQFAAYGAGRRQWLHFLDSLNRSVNGIKRGSFVLRSVELMSEKDKSTATPRKEAKKSSKKKKEAKEEPPELMVKLVFESESDPSRKDIDDLVKLFRDDPRIVDAWPLQRVTRLKQGDGADGAASIWPGRETTIVTMGIMFVSESESGED